MTFSKIIISLFFLLFLFPLNKQAQNFQDVTISAGVNFPHDGTPASNNTHEMGSGAAWIDYDNDGDLDIYYTMRSSSNYLLKNNGDGTFTDVAASLGVQDSGGDGAGVSVVDFNNDGWYDLLLANNVGCKFFKNNGGAFVDITVSSGLSITGNSRGTSATWGDYDNDGYLDLYLVHHDPIDFNLSNYTTQDYLFHNNGNETFTDVSSTLGLSNLIGSGFIAGWTDYDHDNDLDIILINDCNIGPTPRANMVFRNDGGTTPTTWNFTEVSATVLNDCRHGMGIGMGDYDNDSFIDIAYTNVGDLALFRNNNGVFENTITAAGITGPQVWQFSWATNFFDYDLDGWEDLFYVMGSMYGTSVSEPHANYLFKNDQDGTFTNVSVAQNMWDVEKTRNSIIGDYDNDGDEDVFLVNYDEMPMLKKNNNTGNNYLKIKLIGTTSNKDGIGSKLTLTLGNGDIRYHESHNSEGLGGSNTPFIHFGLGTQSTITNLQIRWPSGTLENFTSLSSNSTHFLTEGTGTALPIELISFEASKNKISGSDLNWLTASETNSKEFIIERSANGKDFQKIGMVTAAESSNKELNYSFHDSSPNNGINYYKLKMVDLDGKIEYSPIRFLSFFEASASIEISPNPLGKNQHLSISLNSDFEGELGIKIFDLQGKKVYDTSVFYQNEKITLDNFNSSITQNGIYLIQIINPKSNSIYTKKIIVNQ